MSATLTQNIPSHLNPNWDQQFEVNWNALPPHIARCLFEGSRLNPKDKREFVRFISADIHNACSKPKRRNLECIVQKIVNTFPKSLSDTWCDETAGAGYELLLKKVVHRIENLNRYSNQPKLKYLVDGKMVKTPTYKTYGCSNWQPAIVEDEAELERKRCTMKEMHASGHCKDVTPIVKFLLHETYKLQRREINRGCDISSLKAEWPYLFTVEGLLGHFNELVGIDSRSKLENTLLMKGQKIVSFISRTTEKKSKNVRLRDTLYELLSSGVMHEEMISDMSGLLVLIMEYFQEDKGSIYITIEDAIPKNEVEPLLSVQNISFPLIVVQGQSEFSYSNCMLYVNGKVIIDEIKSFKDAFICLFCIYYCLNIDYPMSAAATLEFIQRCFFGINPLSGTKVQNRFKWKINPKVTKFIEALLEHEPDIF